MRLLIAALLILTASGQTPSSTPDTEETVLFSLINQLRVQNSLPAIAISPALEKAAHWMASDMAAKNYSSETDSLGRGPAARVAAFGFTGNWNDQIIPDSVDTTAYGDGQSNFVKWLTTCNAGTAGATCVKGYTGTMMNTLYNVVGIGRAQGVGGWRWNVVFGSATAAPPPPPPTPVQLTVWRCTVAGALRVGQLTTVQADCGTAVDSGLPKVN